MATPASHASLSACLTSRSCFARATPAFKPSMSASIFTRTALQFLTAVSPTDLISCFTFSVAFAAAARACSLRASILSCASFSAAATASSDFLARTDKSASCWESGLAMYFLHRYLCAHPRLWRSNLPRMFTSEPALCGLANPAEGPWRREARLIVSRRNPTPATSVRSRAERSTFRLSPRKQKVASRGGPKYIGIKPRGGHDLQRNFQSILKRGHMRHTLQSSLNAAHRNKACRVEIVLGRCRR